MQLNLLVLRCENIETSKKFYEKLGLKFEKEQHGKGAIHYSTYVGEMVMELYPLQDALTIENIRLGFTLKIDKIDLEILSEYEFNDVKILVVMDPDGRKVELRRIEETK